jgi:SAM-dependent methyltransferase
MADPLFEEWRVYEKLLIHDYMDHRAFFARLQQEIAQRFERPVALLDLGCGDLTPMLSLLAGARVRRYVGIDESDAALAIVANRLRAFDLSSHLLHGDLLVSLAELDERFDVIVASFALHHLAEPAAKRSTFAASRRLLGPAGFLAIIDVFSDAAETRDQYLERWIDHADHRYVALQPEEKRLLFEHVRARDYPMSLALCRSLGRTAGLARFEVLHEDAAGLNRLITLAPAEPF